MDKSLRTGIGLALGVALVILALSFTGCSDKTIIYVVDKCSHCRSHGHHCNSEFECDDKSYKHCDEIDICLCSDCDN